MKKYFVTLLFIVTISLSSCGVLSNANSSALNGSAWTLVSYNGIPLIPDSAMTATFEDGGISGSASCNHYFGSYEIKDNQIEIAELGWTEMACMEPEGLMEQEQQVMHLLSQAANFSIQGQILQIISGSGELMEFRQIEILD